MKIPTTAILLALLATAFITPSAGASGSPSSPPIPVYSCNAATKPCWNGALACFSVSEQVPFCVQNPCSMPEFQCPRSCAACNLVYVCVAGHTAPSCYGNQQVCVGFSEEIPFCASVGPFDAACMERYWREDVGPVSVVSPNSCSYQVYYDGQPILG